jgi:hypothetical protein
VAISAMDTWNLTPPSNNAGRGQEPASISIEQRCAHLIHGNFYLFGCTLPGEDRTLMQCDLRLVRISAEAAECVKPSISAHPVLPASGPDSLGCCLVFGAATTKDGEGHPRTVLCAATEKCIL